MSTRNGQMEIINKTGFPIKWATLMHQNKGLNNGILSVDELGNGKTSSQMSFQTNSTGKDYWYVSFLDETSGSLWTGYTHCGFKGGDDGGTVQVVLNATDFSVTMPVSGNSNSGDYAQD